MPQTARRDCGPTSFCTSPPRAMSTGRSTARAFIETNIVGTYRPPRSGARTTGARSTAGQRSRLSASTMSRPTRSSASLGDERRVHRRLALSAQFALFRVEGRVRPPRPRLAPHLRAAGRALQLLQQLRPLSVSREAHPADRSSTALEGKPLPVYGTRRECARLALCRRPRARAAARRDARARVGESYNVGGDSESEQSRRRRGHLRARRSSWRPIADRPRDTPR